MDHHINQLSTISVASLAISAAMLALALLALASTGQGLHFDGAGASPTELDSAEVQMAQAVKNLQAIHEAASRGQATD